MADEKPIAASALDVLANVWVAAIRRSVDEEEVAPLAAKLGAVWDEARFFDDELVDIDDVESKVLRCAAIAKYGTRLTSPLRQQFAMYAAGAQEFDIRRLNMMLSNAGTRGEAALAAMQEGMPDLLPDGIRRYESFGVDDVAGGSIPTSSETPWAAYAAGVIGVLVALKVALRVLGVTSSLFGW